MSISVFERLTSEDFAISVAFLSTATALRRFLVRSTEVAEIKEALRQGAISEEGLRRFVAFLLQEFRPGERFRHELPIAALAVALEQRGTDFAEEFLRDLSRLRRNEMSLCSVLARECLKHRASLAKDCGKVLDLGHNGHHPAFFVGPRFWDASGSEAGSVCGSLVLG